MIDIWKMVNYSKYMDQMDQNPQQPVINPIANGPESAISQNQPGKKRIIILAGGIILVFFLVFTLITIFVHKPPQTSTKTSTTPTPTLSTPNSTSQGSKPTSQTYKLNETFNVNKAATAKLTYFTIKYPQDWPPLMNYTSTDGSSFLFTLFPSSISGDSGYFPRMDISYTPATESGSVEQRANLVLRDTGTPETITTFHGYRAIKISGPLHMTLLDSNPPGLKLLIYKTYYVFQKGDLIYLVDYAYNGSAYDPQYEKFFTDILATLTFN